MTVLIKNGTVIDPANNINAAKDILIIKGLIESRTSRKIRYCPFKQSTNY